MELMKTVKNKVGKVSIQIEKRKPEILLVIGIATFVGTVYTACRSTLKAKDVLDEASNDLELIKKAKEATKKDDTYTEEDEKRDKVVVYTKAAAGLVKLYTVPSVLGVTSIACILSSHAVLNERYLAAVGAYNAVSDILNSYRERVRNEYGEKMDRHFRYGTEYKTITEDDIDENGKKIKRKIEASETDKANVEISDFSRVFDETNKYWDRNPGLNLSFLRGLQNVMNDRFKEKGHLFLNEVYNAMGFSETPEGALVGWVDGNGDNYVDFGMYDLTKKEIRDFINGNDNRVLLEFNIDGIIYDKI